MSPCPLPCSDDLFRTGVPGKTPYAARRRPGLRARQPLTDRRARFFVNMPCRHAAGPMTAGLAGFLRVRRPSRRRP